MDFLDIQLDDMTLVEKVKPVYEFPAVYFSKHKNSFVAYFNQRAGNVFNGCKYMKIYATAEYVVFSPVNKKDAHSFAVYYIPSGNGIINCAGLERFRLEGKTYKLYKTEKGFAVKIHDPILNRKEKK